MYMDSLQYARRVETQREVRFVSSAGGTSRVTRAAATWFEAAAAAASIVGSFPAAYVARVHRPDRAAPRLAKSVPSPSLSSPSSSSSSSPSPSPPSAPAPPLYDFKQKNVVCAKVAPRSTQPRTQATPAPSALPQLNATQPPPPSHLVLLAEGGEKRAGLERGAGGQVGAGGARHRRQRLFFGRRLAHLLGQVRIRRQELGAEAA